MKKRRSGREIKKFYVQPSSKKKERVAKKCLADLWLFNWEIMDNKLIDNEFHKSELRKYDERRKKGHLAQLILWPREHLKTTLLSIGGSLRDIAVNVNIRIVIFSDTTDVAKCWSKAIRDHIENSDRYNYYYPYVRPLDTRKTTWKEENFVVRRTRIGIPDGTVEALGIAKANITGKHFDKGIYEDVVNKDNARTFDRREKTKNDYRMSIPLITRRGEKLVIGTIYDKDDLYRDLQNNSFFTVSKRMLTEKDPTTKKEYFIFSKMFDENEKQQRIEDMKDDYLFNCQYYNTPIGSRKKLFPPGSFGYYEDFPKAGKFYTTIDPAGTTESYSNKNVIMTCYWGPKENNTEYGKIFVYRYLWLKMRPEALVTAICNELIEIRPEGASIEIVKDEGLWTLLLNEMEQRNIGAYNILKFKPPTNKSKYERIAMLEPYCKRGDLLVKEEHIELINQADDYTGFMSNEDDDILDALAQQLYLGEHPEGVFENEEHDYDDDYEPLFPGSTNY